MGLFLIDIFAGKKKELTKVHMKSYIYQIYDKKVIKTLKKKNNNSNKNTDLSTIFLKKGVA